MCCGWVIRQAIALAIIGVALGLAASYALTSLMEQLALRCEANRPTDIYCDCGVAGDYCVGCVGLPARRAMKVDPLVALRYE